MAVQWGKCLDCGGKTARDRVYCSKCCRAVERELMATPSLRLLRDVMNVRIPWYWRLFAKTVCRWRRFVRFIDRVSLWPFENEKCVTRAFLCLIAGMLAVVVISQVGMYYGWIQP